MSKKDNPQVKIPTGFRLTNDTRKGLVNVALKDKFGKRTEELFNQEIEYLNAICEYIYPLEKRRFLENGATIFNKMYTPFTFEDSIDIENDTIGLEYNYLTTIRSGLLGDLSYMGWRKDTDTYYVRVPKHEYRYDKYHIYSLLPKTYYKKLQAFINECKLFVQKRDSVIKNLETLLVNYNSAKVLCESYPEFITWIYQYMQLPPSCSDASSHDLMQEIRKTVETV